MALKFQIEGDSSGLRDEARKAVVTINEVGKVAERLGDKIDDAFLDSAKSAEELADAMSKQKAVCKELKAAYDTVKKAADEIADTEGYANDIAKEASDVRTSLNEAYVKQMGYLTEMTKQYESMAEEEEKQSGLLVSLMGGQESYNAIVSALPPELQSCITGLKGMIASANAFIATPLGMVVAALAASVALLGAYFRGATDGEDEFVVISGYAEGVLIQLKDQCVNAGRAMFHMFDEPVAAGMHFIYQVIAPLINRLSALRAYVSNIGDMMRAVFEGDFSADTWAKLAARHIKATVQLESGKNVDAEINGWKEINERAEKHRNLTKEQFQIDHERIALLEREAEIDKEIAKLQEDAYSPDKTKRIEAQAKVEKLNEEKYSKQIELAKREAKIQEELNANSNSTYADLEKAATARAKVIELETAQIRANLMFKRRAMAAQSQLDNANAKASAQATKQDSMEAFLTERDALDFAREARKRALAIKQAEIEGMQEGHERALATIKLNEEKEVLAIEQQKDALLLSKVNKAKQEWAAKGSVGKFDPKSIKLTPEEEADFDKMLSTIKVKYIKLNDDLAKADANAMRDYLAKYGSMEERRLAIVQEYEDKIKTAKNEGEKATLKKEMEKSLGDLNFKQLEMDINWEALFNDLDKISKSHLELLRDQLQKYLQEGIKNGSIDAKNAKVLAERIAKVTEEAQSRSFSLFGGGKTSAGYDALRSNIQSQIAGLMAERNSTDAMKSPERFKELNTQILKLMKTLEDVDKEEKSLRVRARELAEGLSPVIDQMKAVTNLIGNLGLGDTAVGQASSGILSGTSQAQSALSNFANQNYIQAAADAVGALKDYGGAVQKLTGWGGGNADEVNKTTERLTKANEVLTSRIEDLTDAMGNSAGAKAIYAYEQALEAQNDINGNALEILRAQMGYSSAHHSNAYYANDSIIASYNGQAQKAFKAAGVASASITGLDSILGLTPEQIKAIKDFAPDLWKYVTEVGKYDKSEYWDNVVEQAGKAEALTKQIQDNLTQTSFDAMRESYLDALTDMEASSADFAQSIEDMMYKAVVNSLVLNDDFDAWLKEWQSDYANAVKNSNTSQLKQLQDEAVAKRAQLVSERDAIASSMGYATGGSASATINAAMSISEDTAQDIVGRMTAIQLICESERVTLNGMAQSVAQLPTLVDLTTTGNTMLLDMRNLMITSNSYLEDIAKYNKAMYNDWSTKIDRIQSKLETL